MSNLIERHGVDLIANERARQIMQEGWTDAHDDSHTDGSLAVAAACYAWPPPRPLSVKLMWPWGRRSWKPAIPLPEPAECNCRSVGECEHRGEVTPGAVREARIKDLVRAGALIAAEIDRLQRITS